MSRAMVAAVPLTGLCPFTGGNQESTAGIGPPRLHVSAILFMPMHIVTLIRLEFLNRAADLVPLARGVMKLSQFFPFPARRCCDA